MLKKLKKRLINLVAPFILAFYKRDFENLLIWSVEMQLKMLKEAILLAGEKGVHVEIQLEPSTVPMGVTVFHLMDERDREKAKGPDISLVKDDE